MKVNRLKISALGKRLGPRQVLSEIHLEVGQGEICAVVGPNGAGKTTLLLCLMGLRRRDSGQICVNGISHDDPAIRSQWRHTGFLPQSPQFYPHLTLREHLTFVAQIYGGGSTAALHRRIDEELRGFAIEDLADHFPEGLSRGEKQKAALISTWLHSPSLLLYDEPDTALDEAARRRLTNRLRQLAAGGGTVLLTTHDLPLVEALGGRLAVLAGGRLLFDGRLQDLRLALHAGEAEKASDLYQELLRRHYPERLQTKEASLELLH